MQFKSKQLTNLLPANGRIPAIVDKTSGKEKRIFEGAAIQLYLCEKYDKEHKISFEYDSDEYWVRLIPPRSSPEQRPIRGDSRNRAG